MLYLVLVVVVVVASVATTAKCAKRRSRDNDKRKICALIIMLWISVVDWLVVSTVGWAPCQNQPTIKVDDGHDVKEWWMPNSMIVFSSSSSYFYVLYLLRVNLPNCRPTRKRRPLMLTLTQFILPLEIIKVYKKYRYIQMHTLKFIWFINLYNIFDFSLEKQENTFFPLFDKIEFYSLEWVLICLIVFILYYNSNHHRTFKSVFLFPNV